EDPLQVRMSHLG
ncbi:hypothetical protein VCHENC02_4558B, partial [Vibrio harveyi]